MKNHDKIATRLAQILNKLNSGERFSVEELVEEFNVTKRTIQRDLNERLSYLPLKKENDLYFLEEYYLGKLNFDDIKNFAALSGIKELYPSMQEGFLKNILDNTVSQAYMIKGHNYEDMSDKTEEFELIENSIVNSQQIKFDYKEKKRVVNPYKILNSKGIWYLVAEENVTLKTFSLKKVTNLTSTLNKYKIKQDIISRIKNEDNIWFSDKQIEVVLKVDRGVSDYFKRRNILPNQIIIKELEDGDLLVSTGVTFDEEILKIVRYWIPNVKIVSPTYLDYKLLNGLNYYLGR
ncbi:MAG: WYL domain-containing protein [Campylobacterota bacterium]|nr:WYL domain-containing protein [Campylobacterota bacterium]